MRPLFVVVAIVGLTGCASTTTAPLSAAPATDVTGIPRQFDAGGRITKVHWTDDGIYFTRLGERQFFDIASGAFVTDADEPPRARAGEGRSSRRRPGRGRQRMREESPDGALVAVCRDWNVEIEPAGGGAPIIITTDGHRKLRYGTASWVYGEELDQQQAMWWSPDGSRLVFYRFDEQDVPDFYLVDGWTNLRTTTLREGYPKPGEANPQASLLVYDVATGDITPLDTTLGNHDEEWYIYNVRFTPNGDALLVSRTNRHQNHLDVLAADLDTGQSRVVVTERQETWQSNAPLMRFLDDGHRFIWETERSGVAQYELRDLDGRRLAVLTDNPRPVTGISRVDEAAGTLYYTAYGDDPLNVQLYRVGLDGTGARRLTQGRGSHRVQFSPDGRWFTACCETITDMPQTVLYDNDGNRLATLAESDPVRWAELGLPEPELFSFTAADGRTELYGWLYKPPGFDPSRRYPLIIDVYGGPNSKGVRQRFRHTRSGCEYGFLMAKIDNRGTGGRGKSFLGAVYQQLGIVDIQDQADGVRELIKRPYVDADRVGIFGHSYGGYMAALAILKYPDVFQVAVAGAPVTDWRNYDTIYTERYMRTPDENEGGYAGGSCLTYVDQLQGDLLILHGLMDDNVHPNNTWQLVKALQEAGKDFEVMIYPESGHGLRPHAAKLRWAFLREHLQPEASAQAPDQIASK